MSVYYKSHFPSDDVFNFCTLHHEDRPENREVAVTNADDIWRRYNSVRNGRDLRDLALRAGEGATLHLGPHYNEASHRARTPGVCAVGKQLPFDLDLTDVAFLNIPKTDQSANDRFVRLIFGQVHILRAILREVFGFEHFLPVYSGRRGVHLWVLDARADALADEARKAVCAMINPPQSKRDPRLFNRRSIEAHPSFWGDQVQSAIYAVRTRVVLAPYKEGGIGLFDSKLRVEAFLDKLFERGSSDPPSKWREHEDACERHVRATMRNVCGADAFGTLEAAILRELPEGGGGRRLEASQVAYSTLLQKLHDIVFSLLWPTLDVGPSAQMGHCVKMPFSEHGSTKRISLPIEQLLPTASGSSSLPPIVRAFELGTDAEKADEFAKAVSFLRSTVSFARRGYAPPPSYDDIEDLAGRQPKIPRSH